jgi:L-ascorbate metabolism protein UlaG (beta-lactamase superfamily)
MKYSLRVINNATTLINNDFIIDPWIYGKLYNSSWSPYPTNFFAKKKLKLIKFCYISHVHQDHWDLDTIKYFDKKVIFYIADFNFNRIIGDKLKSLNLKNIIYLKFNKDYKINNKYTIKLIPSLNTNGLETENIKNCDNNLIGVDTGIIIKFKDKSNHIILTDNSPYDLKRFIKLFKNIKTSSLFFPYNGFAQDYPLKYDNLSIESKKKISLKMALKREKYLLSFIKYLKPKILIPHSSDFILNTNRNLFYKIHPKEFIDKFLYSKRIEKLTGIKSYGLYAEDELKYVNKTFFPVIKSNYISRTSKPKNIKLTFPEFKKINCKSNLELLIKKSLNQLLIRLKKYKLIVPKNCLIIVLKNSKKNYLINFKKKIIEKNINLKHINLNKNSLILKINKNIFQAILERQIHINNAQIGCYLNWERYSNNYNKFRAIENAMNFFHI